MSFQLPSYPGQPLAAIAVTAWHRGRCRLIASVDSLPGPSGRLTIIIVQHSAQPLAALDYSGTVGARPFVHDQPIAKPLMVPLAMVVRHEFADGLPQRAFSEQNHPVQTRFLDGSNEAFRVRVLECQQLRAMLVNPPIDSASAIRFIPWRERSMKWSADTSVGETTGFFTTAPTGD